MRKSPMLLCSQKELFFGSRKWSQVPKRSISHSRFSGLRPFVWWWLTDKSPKLGREMTFGGVLVWAASMLTKTQNMVNSCRVYSTRNILSTCFMLKVAAATAAQSEERSELRSLKRCNRADTSLSPSQGIGVRDKNPSHTISRSVKPNIRNQKKRAGLG